MPTVGQLWPSDNDDDDDVPLWIKSVASSDSKVARLYLPPGKPEPRAGIPNGKSRRRQPGCQCAAETQPLESCLLRFEPTYIFKATVALKILDKE